MTAADQRNPAQDERPHEDLAQLSVFRHQRPQSFARDFEKLTAFGNSSTHQAALPGDHHDFAGEPARAVCRDGLLALKVRLHDLHASGKQYKKWDVGVAGLKQYFARHNLAQLAARTQTGNLRIGQDGKACVRASSALDAGQEDMGFSYQVRCSTVNSR